MFGISQSALDMIHGILARYDTIQKVLIYGSRAKGNYHARSDVDLVICESQVDRNLLGELITHINESDFPYTVDIQVLENIKNLDLIEHIQRVGKIFYVKNSKQTPQK